MNLILLHMFFKILSIRWEIRFNDMIYGDIILSLKR